MNSFVCQVLENTKRKVKVKMTASISHFQSIKTDVLLNLLKLLIVSVSDKVALKCLPNA